LPDINININFCIFSHFTNSSSSAISHWIPCHSWRLLVAL
jgi:hypothetical protein